MQETTLKFAHIMVVLFFSWKCWSDFSSVDFFPSNFNHGGTFAGGWSRTSYDLRGVCVCVQLAHWMLCWCVGSGVCSYRAGKWDLACLKGAGNKRTKCSPCSFSPVSLCWLFSVSITFCLMSSLFCLQDRAFYLIFFICCCALLF